MSTHAAGDGPRLPIGPPLVRERADAARNRQRALAAAESLFAQRGVHGVTMDDVAAAAGIGKGTLYRRFTDKGGLASALLSERAIALQHEILGGPPPLGPGAPAELRLRAFTAAYLRFQATHLDLVLLSETSTPGARLRKGSFAFWVQHAEMLLRTRGARDPLERAEVLLAGLSAEQVSWWLRDQGRDLETLCEAMAAMADSLGSG